MTGFVRKEKSFKDDLVSGEREPGNLYVLGQHPCPAALPLVHVAAHQTAPPKPCMIDMLFSRSANDSPFPKTCHTSIDLQALFESNQRPRSGAEMNQNYTKSCRVFGFISGFQMNACAKESFE